MWLTQLAGAMPVDLMPGATDPANHSLPQQPLHHCLFPGAAAFPTLNRSAAVSAVAQQDLWSLHWAIFILTELHIVSDVPFASHLLLHSEFLL